MQIKIPCNRAAADIRQVRSERPPLRRTRQATISQLTAQAPAQFRPIRVPAPRLDTPSNAPAFGTVSMCEPMSSRFPPRISRLPQPVQVANRVHSDRHAQATPSGRAAGAHAPTRVGSVKYRLVDPPRLLGNKLRNAAAFGDSAFFFFLQVLSHWRNQLLDHATWP